MIFISVNCLVTFISLCLVLFICLDRLAIFISLHCWWHVFGNVNLGVRQRRGRRSFYVFFTLAAAPFVGSESQRTDISISMYIMCVILCLFSALSRRVGALQISIIINMIIIHVCICFTLVYLHTFA